MIYAKKYHRYAFISVPAENGLAIDVGEGRIITQLIVSEDTKEQFWPAEAKQLKSHIYDKVVPTASSNCVKSIMKKVDEKQLQSVCKTRKMTIPKAEFLTLEKDWVVNITPDPSHIKVSCNETSVNITERFTLVHGPECSF